MIVHQLRVINYYSPFIESVKRKNKLQTNRSSSPELSQILLSWKIFFGQKMVHWTYQIKPFESMNYEFTMNGSFKMSHKLLLTIYKVFVKKPCVEKIIFVNAKVQMWIWNIYRTGKFTLKKREKKFTVKILSKNSWVRLCQHFQLQHYFRDIDECFRWITWNDAIIIFQRHNSKLTKCLLDNPKSGVVVNDYHEDSVIHFRWKSRYFFTPRMCPRTPRMWRPTTGRSTETIETNSQHNMRWTGSVVIVTGFIISSLCLGIPWIAALRCQFF